MLQLHGWWRRKWSNQYVFCMAKKSPKYTGLIQSIIASDESWGKFQAPFGKSSCLHPDIRHLTPEVQTCIYICWRQKYFEMIFNNPKQFAQLVISCRIRRIYLFCAGGSDLYSLIFSSIYRPWPYLYCISYIWKAPLSVFDTCSCCSVDLSKIKCSLSHYLQGLIRPSQVVSRISSSAKVHP